MRTTVQSLTIKLAIFIGKRFMLTIHRQDQGFLQDILKKYRNHIEPVYLHVTLLEILSGAVETYCRPLADIEHRILDFENAIMKNNKSISSWDLVFQERAGHTSRPDQP